MDSEVVFEDNKEYKQSISYDSFIDFLSVIALEASYTEVYSSNSIKVN